MLEADLRLLMNLVGEAALLAGTATAVCSHQTAQGRLSTTLCLAFR